MMTEGDKRARALLLKPARKPTKQATQFVISAREKTTQNYYWQKDKSGRLIKVY